MISENIERVKEKINESARKAGRSPDEVKLILVSKTVSVDKVQEAYEAGAKQFGENKVQELIKKKPLLPQDIQWHFIGHLQTNKVKDIAGQAVLIHSLDSMHLAKEIEKNSGKRNIISEVLFEVNISGEQSKFGFKPEELEDKVGEITRFAHIKSKGLMTIGPQTEDLGLIRSSFRKLTTLRDRMKQIYPDLCWDEISMGMSDDYPIAVEEGATMLRIGRAVFGEREK